MALGELDPAEAERAVPVIKGRRQDSKVEEAVAMAPEELVSTKLDVPPMLVDDSPR